MANKDMWWDLKEVLSYNALWNFVVGNRGGGKSYGFKKWAAEDFIKNGKQFIYVRRYKSELTQKAKETFWDAVRKEFPDHELRGTDDGCYWIDGRLAGQTRFLSTAKSEEFPDVNKICFDEFITNDLRHHPYLRDEVMFFSELYETIARMRPVKVFFFGNALSWSNPYFTFFDIRKPKNKKQIATCKDGTILIQLYSNDEYIEKKEATPFGRLMKDTRYGRYAVHNEFYMDSAVGVAKRPGNASYKLGLQINGEIIGLWYDLRTGRSYLSHKYSPGSGTIYALTTDDHDYNTVLLNRRPKPPWVAHLISQYRNGALFCEDEGIRHNMMDILSIIGV